MTDIRKPLAPLFTRSPTTATVNSTTTTAPTTTTAAAARRFEFAEGNSSKFWSVAQQGSTLQISWGRIGTAGQSQHKVFDSDAKATTALAKLVAEKVGKGYVEAGGNSPSLPVGVGNVLGGPALGGAGAPSGGVSAMDLRTGNAKRWSDLDDEGKADALTGDQNLIGATWSEDVDLAKLSAAQKVIVDKIIKLAEGSLGDNDDADGGENIVRIGDPEASVNLVSDLAGNVLGVAVSWRQRGGAFRDDEDAKEDDDGDGRDSFYPDRAAAVAAGVDADADVSWCTSEVMVFDAKGKELRDNSGAYWEWTGW